MHFILSCYDCHRHFDMYAHVDIKATHTQPRITKNYIIYIYVCVYDAIKFYVMLVGRIQHKIDFSDLVFFSLCFDRMRCWVLLLLLLLCDTILTYTLIRFKQVFPLIFLFLLFLT